MQHTGIFIKCILLALIFITNSCATLLYRKTYPLPINLESPKSTFQYNGKTYHSGTAVEVKRSKQDILITEINDTLRKVYIIRPSLNPMFLFGNLCLFTLSPAGYLVDLTNSKKYYYGEEIYLDIHDTISIIHTPLYLITHKYLNKEYENRENQLNIILSVPYVNSFYLRPPSETGKYNTGFWGLSAGIEFYTTPTTSYMLSALAATDYMIPIPVGVEKFGEYETLYTLHASGTYQMKHKRFNTGIGLSLASNIWSLNYRGEPDTAVVYRTPVTKRNQSIGFHFNIDHQLNEHFFVGIMYRPTFYQFSPQTKFNYEHFISLNFQLKMSISSGKKRIRKHNWSLDKMQTK